MRGLMPEDFAMFLVLLLALAVGIAFYLLPAMIAKKRRAKHETAIFAINVLFGWTVLGWLAALLWAVAEKTDAERLPTSAEIKARLRR